jgi:4-amino-4-deoxy-L-arabinose transferase-like glycosyltransferase
LACLPFGEFSFNDDWSYSHIALNFFRLGHMAYDGWCTPTLLVQALWGSLLIRTFGFSFELLRFSTLLVAVGCAVLLQRLGRSAGLTPITATFASLALVTSPLFIPLATSFMTDVWACFFMLLCFYLAVKALTSMRPALWLTAALIAGFVGGLDRQTVYIAPGSALLWALWRWRREPRMLGAVVFLLAALGVGALLALR